MSILEYWTCFGLCKYGQILGFRKMQKNTDLVLIRHRNPRPLGVVRVCWLCLKNAFEIAVAKP